MKIKDVIDSGKKKFYAVCHEFKKFETNDSAIFEVVKDEIGFYIQFDCDVEDMQGMKCFSADKKYNLNYSKIDWDIEVIPDKYLVK